MNHHLDQQISLRDWVETVWRRKGLVVLCLACASVPAVIYNQLAEPLYRAQSRVLFDGNEKVMDYNLLDVFNRNSFVANKLEEMKTYPFAQGVYDEMPPAARQLLLARRPLAPGSDSAHAAISQIQRNLSPQLVKGADIINIEFESGSPELAQFVVNAAAQVAAKSELSTRRQQYQRITGFIEHQFELVKNRLQTSELELKDFKETHELTSLEDESRELLQRTTQAEILYNGVQSDIRQLEERLAAARTRLESEKVGLSESFTETRTLMAGKLKDKLVMLQIQYSELEVQGVPLNNPKMMELRNEIAQTKENLAQEAVALMQGTSLKGIVDPVAQVRKHLEESIDLEVELQALAAKKQSLQTLLGSYSAAMRKLPETEMRLLRLLRDREVDSDLYKKLLEELEGARIKEAAEISNIRVLETSRLPMAPVWPRKMLNVLVAMVFGTITGIFIAHLLESQNDTLRTREDVERAIGFPVIASIPNLKHDFDLILNRNENKFRETAGKNDVILQEAYHLLCNNLNQMIPSRSIVMITSTMPNEGKTTLAAMIALMNARHGKKTLLIDANLRRPALHAFFRTQPEPGLTDVVGEYLAFVEKTRLPAQVGHNQVDPATTAAALQQRFIYNDVGHSLLQGRMMATIQKNLVFLPGGFAPLDASRIWMHEIWPEIFSQLKKLADLTVIDGPPVMGAADAAIMSAYVDCVLFCVESGGIAGQTLEQNFRLFGEASRNARDKIAGVILTKVAPQDFYGWQQYYSSR